MSETTTQSQIELNPNLLCNNTDKPIINHNILESIKNSLNNNAPPLWSDDQNFTSGFQIQYIEDTTTDTEQLETVRKIPILCKYENNTLTIIRLFLTGEYIHQTYGPNPENGIIIETYPDPDPDPDPDSIEDKQPTFTYLPPDSPNAIFFSDVIQRNEIRLNNPYINMENRKGKEDDESQISQSSNTSYRIINGKLIVDIKTPINDDPNNRTPRLYSYYMNDVTPIILIHSYGEDGTLTQVTEAKITEVPEDLEKYNNLTDKQKTLFLMLIGAITELSAEKFNDILKVSSILPIELFEEYESIHTNISLQTHFDTLLKFLITTVDNNSNEEDTQSEPAQETNEEQELPEAETREPAETEEEKENINLIRQLKNLKPHQLQFLFQLKKIKPEINSHIINQLIREVMKFSLIDYKRIIEINNLEDLLNTFNTFVQSQEKEPKYPKIIEILTELNNTEEQEEAETPEPGTDEQPSNTKPAQEPSEAETPETKTITNIQEFSIDLSINPPIKKQLYHLANSLTFDELSKIFESQTNITNLINTIKNQQHPLIRRMHLIYQLLQNEKTKQAIIKAYENRITNKLTTILSGIIKYEKDNYTIMNIIETATNRMMRLIIPDYTTPVKEQSEEGSDNQQSEEIKTPTNLEELNPHIQNLITSLTTIYHSNSTTPRTKFVPESRNHQSQGKTQEQQQQKKIQEGKQIITQITQKIGVYQFWCTSESINNPHQLTFDFLSQLTNIIKNIDPKNPSFDTIETLYIIQEMLDQFSLPTINIE